MVKSTRVGALRYDVTTNSDYFQREMAKNHRMTANLRRAMERTRTPIERYNVGLLKLDRALEKGTIDSRAYKYELDRLNRELKEGSVMTDLNSAAINKNSAAKRLNAKATRGMNWANIGGSAGSALGAGGAGAGAARLGGIGIGGGLGGGALVAGIVGIYATVKSLKEYAKIEASTAELQVYLGTKKGLETSSVMRNIAANSALTTQQLVKNAAVLLSYGNEFEDLTDFTKRLGQASGGDTTQFNNLTKAFAQINAMGKLMGQEKNQLVNAGFSLKLIAKVAGIQMKDFQKSMEEGLITSEMVNKALIDATSAGGLYETRLDRQGNTLAGKWDIMINNANEAFATFGELMGSDAKGMFSGMTEYFKEAARKQGAENEINSLESETNRILKLIEFNTGVAAKDSVTESEWDKMIQESFVTKYSKYGESTTGQQAGADFYKNMGFQDHTWTNGIFDSIANGNWDFLDLPETRELKRRARTSRAQYGLDSATRQAEKLGIRTEIDPEKGTKGGDLVDSRSEAAADASKKSLSLSSTDFGANSVGEYNYIRDMMNGDNYEEKSFFQLKQIAENTAPGQKMTEAVADGLRRRAGTIQRNILAAEAKAAAEYAASPAGVADSQYEDISGHDKGEWSGADMAYRRAYDDADASGDGLLTGTEISEYARLANKYIEEYRQNEKAKKADDNSAARKSAVDAATTATATAKSATTLGQILTAIKTKPDPKPSDTGVAV